MRNYHLLLAKNSTIYLYIPTLMEWEDCLVGFNETKQKECTCSIQHHHLYWLGIECKNCRFVFKVCQICLKSDAIFKYLGRANLIGDVSNLIISYLFALDIVQAQEGVSLKNLNWTCYGCSIY